VEADSLPTAEKKPPRLRWHQFSLRTLLIFVTAGAILMSWFAVKMKQAHRQKEVIAQIEYATDNITQVAYDYQFDKSGNFDKNAKPSAPSWLVDRLGIDFFANVVYLHIDSANDGIKSVAVEPIFDLPQLREASLGSITSESDLEQLSKLKYLEVLHVSSDHITDSGIAPLKNLPRLKHLTLMGDRITDDAFVQINEMKQLRYLEISFGKFTGAGLGNLKDLKNLRTLYLHDFRCKQKLNGKEFESIAELTQLKILGIDVIQLTDANLECLKGLTQLEKIEIWSGYVTPEGMTELLKALPNATSNYIDEPGSKVKVLSNEFQRGGIGFM
jgi:hypothetical protein